ncbi:glucuronyl hydrolase [Sinomicrobium pectinilyticum]|uniref:Glucuronyl hydrolase n=1 Tax=Sinomicrobium pectinilyticum TaxID=1084421 RepID=A0A3N0E3F1_SINP1|nr:glycoside hydrolase family 88 protein [Sinomicrobium pectinilyticum]RNL82372.1 glucuronyl hydrolase [Sinomicrobium pectinilyticum]
MKKLGVYFLLIFVVGMTGCGKKRDSDKFNLNENLDYCVAQASQTLKLIPGDSVLPRNITAKTGGHWKFVPFNDWTSGFWPGTLWYLYEYTGEEKWKREADRFSRYLTPLSVRSATDHDLGFQVFCSFGNGYRLTKDTGYRKTILRTADTLAALYNPKVGTLLSWPGMTDKMGWPHNTIIDNMMNLELLFWAGKNGGNDSLYDIALKHAETTMQNHFRKDHSVYHVVVYDTVTGKKVRGVTHQGYSDDSLWARGQAWAIYGYTMTYRETGNDKFLDFAQKVADVYLDRLPEDMIPFWDFDAPHIPHEPKDASAAAITASALLELSGYIKDPVKASFYRESAEKMLGELSAPEYRSNDRNTAFLLHSTGHYPNGSEVDASIIYADYYYLEALLRLKKLEEGKAVADFVPVLQK